MHPYSKKLAVFLDMVRSEQRARNNRPDRFDQSGTHSIPVPGAEDPPPTAGR